MLSARLHLFSSVVAACWFGSLCAVGFMVVPLVFANLAPVAVAGNLAAKLFTAQTWLSMGCSVLLLMLWRSGLGDGAPQPLNEAEDNGLEPGGANRPDTLLLGVLVAGLLLDLVLQLVAIPRIGLRQNLAFWHGAGTALYVVQWLCALLAVWRLAQPRRG